MSIILGVNHQFLYPAAMTDAAIHCTTLKKVAEYTSVQALDCWVWPEKTQSREEIRILKDSGRWINYNIGDRPMDEPCFPGSPDKNRGARGLDILRREVDYAVEIGARRIVMGSGSDVPEDREGAKDRYAAILMELKERIPDDVILTLEPTDRDVDKRFLFGPVKETADFIRRLRREGFSNFAMLLDMGHIPIMHETIESAVANAGDTLAHIHLGNAIIRNPRHPFYGDKHVAWGASESEYGSADAARFLRLLNESGYFSAPESTVSFEMRAIEGYTPEESLAAFVEVFRNSMSVLPARNITVEGIQ